MTSSVSESFSPRSFIPPVDNLTLPQLIFDYAHPTRPQRPADVPCMIDDETGRRVFLSEVRDTDIRTKDGDSR